VQHDSCLLDLTGRDAVLAAGADRAVTSAVVAADMILVRPAVMSFFQPL